MKRSEPEDVPAQLFDNILLSRNGNEWLKLQLKVKTGELSAVSFTTPLPFRHGGPTLSFPPRVQRSSAVNFRHQKSPFTSALFPSHMPSSISPAFRSLDSNTYITSTVIPIN